MNRGGTIHGQRSYADRDGRMHDGVRVDDSRPGSRSLVLECPPRGYSDRVNRGDVPSLAAILVLVVGVVAACARIFPSSETRDLGADRALLALGVPRLVARPVGWVLEAVASLLDAVA
jgi:hypothetical protein